MFRHADASGKPETLILLSGLPLNHFGQYDAHRHGNPQHCDRIDQEPAPARRVAEIFIMRHDVIHPFEKLGKYGFLELSHMTTA